MNQPTVTTSRKNLPYSFYVQCKGEHSGRPLASPIANCFEVTCSDAAEYEYWYWLTWGAWNGKAFHPLLRGSVIPFIRICDYKAVMQKAASHSHPRTYVLQRLQVMRNIDTQQNNIRKQLQLLQQMKAAIFEQATR
jgi:hypothetical protein